LHELQKTSIIYTFQFSVSGKIQDLIKVGEKAIKSVTIDNVNPTTGSLVVNQTIKEIITIKNTHISNFDVPPNPFLIDKMKIIKLPMQMANIQYTVFLFP
jgi:hypothetical protein